MNKTQNLGMWMRKENDFITFIVRKCLNIDFALLRFLSKHKIHIGGLSLLAVCKCKGGFLMYVRTTTVEGNKIYETYTTLELRYQNFSKKTGYPRYYKDHFAVRYGNCLQSIFCFVKQ
ncbi:hypothetical protein C823_007163 [Eubacterium plexicaudatum ASF492]|nr:hypothetical protein C823_007163 [Eubacterium plexicaudatum ASF492]